MSTKMSVTYPVSKEEYGNAVWKVMHSYTANLPERLSSDDKRKFKTTLLDLIERFPCSDCKDHALLYMKENKPKENSKTGYFNYLCEFHNHVNIKNGKPTQDCQTISIKQHSCPTCSHSVNSIPTQNSNSQQNTPTSKNDSRINQIIDYRLNQQLTDYKDTSKKIVEKMCQNAGEPVPEITFSDQTPCSDPSTSCTHMPVAPGGKLLPGTRIHFNVNQYSPRTAVHETMHYLKKAKGLDTFDEKTVENDARTIISRDFPFDTRMPSKQSFKEVKDTPKAQLTPMDPGYLKERVARRLSTVSENFPYFSKYYHGAKSHKKEEPAPGVVPTVTYSDGRPVYPQIPTQTPEKQEPPSASEGFTSMLDPIYAPFAGMLGLKPRDVNDAHTPALLANGAIVLAESNLNRFGSMAFSLISSLLTLAVGTLAKEQIGFADKKLLVGLGGALLWNGGLRYIANPKIHEEVVGQAMDFGQSLSGMDLESMAASMTMDVPKEIDPEKQMMKPGGPKSLHRNISSPVGGGTRKISRNKTQEIDSSDIYEDPDSTIASQGFRRDSPFFPSGVGT